MNQSSTAKTSAELRAEAAALIAAAEAAEAEKIAQLAAAADAERAAEQRAAREAQRNAPEPAFYAIRRDHLTAIAAQLLGKVEADQKLHPAKWALRLGSEMMASPVIIVTPPKKTIAETDAGPNVMWEPPTLTIKHRGCQIYHYIDWQAEQRHDGSRFYRGQHTGKVRLVVGDFGDRKSYPPRKDGTYDYEGVASKLFAKVVSAEVEAQKALTKLTNKDALEALKAEFDVASNVLSIESYHRGYNGREGSTLVAPVGHVFLTINKTVTPDQARTILAACRQAGIKP